MMSGSQITKTIGCACHWDRLDIDAHQRKVDCMNKKSPKKSGDVFLTKNWSFFADIKLIRKLTLQV